MILTFSGPWGQRLFGIHVPLIAMGLCGAGLKSAVEAASVERATLFVCGIISILLATVIYVGRDLRTDATPASSPPTTRSSQRASYFMGILSLSGGLVALLYRDQAPFNVWIVVGMVCVFVSLLILFLLRRGKLVRHDPTIRS